MLTLPLGRAVRQEWRLDPDFLTVNHGSFGATPISVLDAQADWRRRMEAQPTRFMALILPDALAVAKARLGTFLGADPAGLAFVDNATSGCNAVLRSLRLRAGDEVLVLDHGYGAVRNTVRFVTERAGALMTEAAVPFPDVSDDAILTAIRGAIAPNTRIAVIDHITSASALVLPVAAISALCRDAGVKLLIDGAHAPGHIDLNLEQTGADWYTGNCHKWLCAPKGCAFLWTSPARRDETHPNVISHGLGLGYDREFDWTGTRDFSAVLTVGDCIDFHEQLGGALLRRRNVALAAEAAAELGRRLNGDTVESRAAMRLVRLPPSAGPDALSFRARLLRAGTDAPVHRIGGHLWLRLSAFAYNELDDYARLAEIVMKELSV